MARLRRSESSFGAPRRLATSLWSWEQPRVAVPAARPGAAAASPPTCTSGKKKPQNNPQPNKPPKKKTTNPPKKRNVAAVLGSERERCQPAEWLFVFYKLFASRLWRRLRTSLANICTNFMLIKIRLLRQAWLLSHSYYYCLDLWYYKRKGKACSRRVMVVNFSREGFSLQFFSINDCCMNGLWGLLEDSADPLGNPCCNMYAGFFSSLFR